MFELLREGLHSTREERILEGEPCNRSRFLRPSIPVLLTCAAAMWRGACLGQMFAWRQYVQGDTLQYLTVIAAGVAFVMFLLIAMLVVFIQKTRKAVGAYHSRHAKRRRRCRNDSTSIFRKCQNFSIVFLSITLCLCCALLCSLLYWNRWCEDVSFLKNASFTKRIFEVTGDVEASRYGFRTSGLMIVDNNTKIPIAINWDASDEIPAAGQSLQAFCRYNGPTKDEYGERTMRTGSRGSVQLFMQEDLCWVQGASGSVGYVRERVRDSLARFDSDGSALLQGILLGDRSLLSGSSCEEDFRLTGLAHLIAVSGSHLVVVNALAGWALARLRLPRLFAAGILIGTSALYCLMSGLQISALRALVMAACGMMATLPGRRRDSLAACALCICTFSCFAPSSMFSFSLQLSVAAVLGIIVFSPLLRAWCEHILPRRLSMLADPIALTLAAQFTTLPMTVSNFALIPLVSPLANIVVAPLISLLLGVGIITTCFTLLIPAASVVIALPVVLANGVVSLVGFLASIPHASIAASWDLGVATVAFLGLSLFLWIVWPLPSRKKSHIWLILFATGTTLAFVLATLPITPSLIMLDVGQGDALLLRDGRTNLLIDTGADDETLLKALARNGVQHLDGVLVTHLHDDHCGALDALVGVINVSQVFFAQDVRSLDKEGVPYEVTRVATQLVGEEGIAYLTVGTTLRTEHFCATVVAPHKFTQEGGNADSICLLIESLIPAKVGSSEAALSSYTLLTGDAEQEELAKLIETQLVGDIDVLKVGHHGSAASLSNETLHRLRPQIALVSVGEANEYGHPAPSTITALERQGCLIWRTDLCGDITVRYGAGAIEVASTKDAVYQ